MIQFTRNAVEFQTNDSETTAESLLSVMRQTGTAPAAIGERLLLGKPTQPRQTIAVFFIRSLSLWDDGPSYVLRLGLMNYSEPPLSCSLCYDQQAQILLLLHKSVNKNVRQSIKGCMSWRDQLIRLKNSASKFLIQFIILRITLI
jgi:hypothetical protein